MYRTAIVVALSVLALQRPGVALAETGVELLRNGGCEEALVGGNIPDWEEVQGSGWTQRQTSPPPHEGISYFFAGVVAQGELRQVVDVSVDSLDIDAGLITGAFTGWVRSFDQNPPDGSRVVLEYRDGGGSLLASYDSGERTNMEAWEAVDGFTALPPGTRQARVRLISTRHSGSNNDGYYDDLSFTLEYTFSGLSLVDRAPGIELEAPFPNPTDGPVHLRVHLDGPHAVIVRILDSGGRSRGVAERHDLSAGAHLVSRDLAGARLAAGRYFVLVSTREGSVARPIVVLDGQ